MPLVTTATRSVRAGGKFLHGLFQTEHPLLVHLIPIRRCNIDCGYCNEYDKVSPPVPFDTMMARVDKLAELGTAVVAFSGGEPLLHPQLDDLIRRIRRHGMMAGLITNGFLLSEDRIRALNEAGIPIDMIGGTSMGAMVSSLYAMGMDYRAMTAVEKESIARKPFNEFSLPFIGKMT